MQRGELIDLAVVTSRLAHICSGGGKWMFPKSCRCRAVVAAVAVLIGGAWDAAAYADGGASARSQTSLSAPIPTPSALQAYAQQILRALADRHADNWIRYGQARADCAAAAHHTPATPIDRVLLSLTAAICVQLDDRLGVNPVARPPRGYGRGAGLMINEPGAAAGYILFSVRGAQKVYLIDTLGRTAHTWHLEETLAGKSISLAKLLDNWNLMALAVEPGAPEEILEFDPRGNAVWRSKGRRLHHDFLKMPNGNVMMLVRGRKTREEAIAAGANPEFVHKSGIEYDYLLEVRPEGGSGGEIVWEWSAWDHLVQDFDQSKPNYGAIAEHPELIDINFPLEAISERRQHAPRDWLHTNAIDYNPALDQIMLSPRHFSELWIIDHSATAAEARGHSGGNSGMGGDLLYRWGNPRAYGLGDAGDQRLFWQHHAHWIAPGLPGAGNILVFNNGNEFTGDERGYSSVDEIAPPADSYGYRRDADSAYPPDGPEWTYAAETPADFYAPFRSGTQRLPNGNTLVVGADAGAIFQVTPDGKPVWKYIIPRHYHISLWQDEGTPERLTHGTPNNYPSAIIKNGAHRAYWYPPDYAGLQALDLAPGAYLAGEPDLLDWARAAILAGDFGERLADARYDIYLDEKILIYFKQSCAATDTRAKFFLHIIPEDAQDLPVHRREYGFDNRDFNFTGLDVHALYDWCVAIRMLPDYAIERIRTGQFTSEGAAWRAEVELGE